MQLIHFTNKNYPLKEITYREQEKDWFKPTGFWVSDEDDAEAGWWSWCLREDYAISNLELAYAITLAEDHNILILNKAEQVRYFSNKFVTGKLGKVQWYIDWNSVRELWDGLIITPYLDEIRYELEHMWYTTWDCAGGCIWNPKAIERFDTCQMSS